MAQYIQDGRPMRWPRKPWAFEAAAVLAEVVLTLRYHYDTVLAFRTEPWEEARALFMERVQECLDKERMHGRVLGAEFFFDDNLWAPNLPEERGRVGCLHLAFNPADRFRWLLDFGVSPDVCLSHLGERHVPLNPFHVEWVKE